jgi:transcription-repair coupling factor (superfamily II helicase)
MITDLTIAPNSHNKQYLPILPMGGDSLCIANIHQPQRPLLVIANDSYITNRIHDELALFAPQLSSAIFPDHEILPYERTSPRVEVIAKRLKILWQISLNQLDVVIVSANILQTRLCPLSYLHSRQLILKVGDKISITRLREQLVASYYSLTTQVHEAGEFAVRGGIIDIMPMGSRQMIRLELFDDEIESLKIIQPQTLAIVDNVDKYELIPAREYPTDKQSIKQFVAKFGSIFNKPEHLALIREMGNGLLPAGSEFYLPLFFDTTSTLFDYMNDSWQVIYYENLLTHLNLNYQEIRKRYELFNYQYPCLKPAELFILSDIVLNEIKKFKSYIFIENIETLTSNKKEIDANLAKQLVKIPDISVNHQLQNPFTKFLDFRATLSSGIAIIVTSSLGRLEILRETLEKYDIPAQTIKSLNQIISGSKLNITSDNQPVIAGRARQSTQKVNNNKHIAELDFGIGKSNIYIIQANLYNSFVYNNTAFITEEDLYKSGNKPIFHRRRANTPQIDNDLIIRDLAEIQVGDYVVHINHGIGKYIGLSTQNIADIDYEMLELEYQGESKLFIPVNNLHLISRYSRFDNTNTELSKLGSGGWAKVRAKTEAKVSDLAVQLLELYAKRQIQSGHKFVLPEEYNEFAAGFGYEPTVDQETSITAIIDDMTSGKPMDRLICGDVGFGKTEVAIRAAFICAMNGKQVAILSPTTLLTEQHYENFVNRFANLPIKIAEVSRFRTKKEIANTLELVKAGRVDILIGTHRLIQDDIRFHNLGLVIIDEEHRFGVKQKEKLKQLRANTDFLALTATPIPRTLSMALDGLRDFSIITTPPKKRLPINTIIIQDDNEAIREAILRELRRGGQVFFLYNDVANIEKMYNRLHELMPELSIAIAHGQMNETVLEQTIREFIHQKYNLLLCSTIIETGIDIANTNTIIIYRADKFGLAQLHQLRGRVGRSHHQAYCYMVVPENLSSDAEKRLDAIHFTTELGAGVNLAMHDLEIRGAGEVLGDKQSGDIKHVGLSLYTTMLKKAIRKLKSHDKAAKADISLNNEFACEVNLNTTAIIADDYCYNIYERLIYYKRLASGNTIDEIDTVYQEIINNYGLPPESLKSLIQSHYLRVKAATLGIQKLDTTDSQIRLTFVDNPPIEPLKIVLLMQKLKTVKYDGKNKLVWTFEQNSIHDKIKNANLILNELI